MTKKTTATTRIKLPTHMDGMMTTATMIKPLQLELELVTTSNVLTKQYRPCSSILDGVLAPGSIPGLDATLCRCDACKVRAGGGIWWFDSWMRLRVLKRQVAYNFTVSSGDGLRDMESP
jgi:hypothetical protein